MRLHQAFDTELVLGTAGQGALAAVTKDQAVNGVFKRAFLFHQRGFWTMAKHHRLKCCCLWSTSCWLLTALISYCVYTVYIIVLLYVFLDLYIVTMKVKLHKDISKVLTLHSHYYVRTRITQVVPGAVLYLCEVYCRGGCVCIRGSIYQMLSEGSVVFFSCAGHFLLWVNFYKRLELKRKRCCDYSTS